MADIEKAVKRELGIDLDGKLIALQAPLEKSKQIYDEARAMLSVRDEYDQILGV